MKGNLAEEPYKFAMQSDIKDPRSAEYAAARIYAPMDENDTRDCFALCQSTR